MSIDKIVIKGARENNLKNINLELPRDKMIVFTGLSGSGKSSLAFNTIYAEGQRRYVESLSSYARQFLGQMDKPDVEYIEGLSPSIAIDQKTTSKNPRSTVGTVTEIYDYFRLIFSKIATPYCPVCGEKIVSQSVDEIVDKIMGHKEREKLILLAPIIRGKKGEHKRILDSVKREGFTRLYIDGKEYEIQEEISLDKNKKHDIDVVVDRIIVKDGIETRLTDSTETALKLGNGLVKVMDLEGNIETFSEKLTCPNGHITIEEVEPRSFSFNSPFGMCEDCNGLGFHLEVDEDLVIPNYNLSLKDGAIDPFHTSQKGTYYYEIFKTIIEDAGFTEETLFKDLPKKTIDEILYGTNRDIRFKFNSHFSGHKIYKGPFEGVINTLNRRYHQTNSDAVKDKVEEYFVEKTCKTCNGKRLKKEILSMKINGLNISEVTDMSVTKALEWFKDLKLSKTEEKIARLILKEIIARLEFLDNVGLGYLTLSRAAGSLSGGESQRIRLATQIGSALVGVSYVLDEPSIGLHQRDNHLLIKSLRNLTDVGNTLIVVEHDEDTMIASDMIVDIGPGAGVHGGEIVFQGTYDEILKDENSITGKYLSRRLTIEPPEKRKNFTDFLEIKGAREHNLKNIDVKIPLGSLTLVTGVSGSGKSSLINSILEKELSRKLNRARTKSGDFDKIVGYEKLDKVVKIDQSPIGRTPRSNPATYTKIFDRIREIFAMTKDAKMRGYKKGRFSFNVSGGRCENCHGDGTIKVEMHFLPDVYVPCEVCHGKRYNRETLQVKYKGKTIADVLDMTIEEASVFFENIPNLKSKLDLMVDVGIGYLKLGQSSTELSGGEAQRVKLALELSKRATGKTIYILDEPTTGLHTHDIKKLIAILNRLVEGGNTVVVIEHNLDVIKCADYVVDLGPEGGDKGGELVFQGEFEDLLKCEESYTGIYLKKELEKDKKLKAKFKS
ncbi:excinuclease ABC subunit UvrA [Citroniella saccharovorans]|uniref:UvrABC system protein A n=1 Tax=Citroniella saccharovorans TaxID=2053367 RepID=A0AAW9MR84_9FIRM|nr:excinuclease ABC subunit UvrA [Citroniella saccharovorans]MEB3428461.1 excinuclease ABC subunit UvrA [Citroniella saccharovorans]